MASSFKFDTGPVLAGLSEYSRRINAGLTLFGDVAARKLEAYAKANKPWENRTSHAMQSIQGTSRREGGNIVIELSGGMEYSPYLEFAMDKRYAIIFPTMQAHKGEILAGIRTILG